MILMTGTTVGKHFSEKYHSWQRFLQKRPLFAWLAQKVTYTGINTEICTRHTCTARLVCKTMIMKNITVCRTDTCASTYHEQYKSVWHFVVVVVFNLLTIDPVDGDQFYQADEEQREATHTEVHQVQQVNTSL